MKKERRLHKMTNEDESQRFELEMHDNIMNSCSYQQILSGSCSFYNEGYCIYEEDQQKCPKYKSVRESEEFFESKRNKK